LIRAFDSQTGPLPILNRPHPKTNVLDRLTRGNTAQCLEKTGFSVRGQLVKQRWMGDRYVQDASSNHSQPRLLSHGWPNRRQPGIFELMSPLLATKAACGKKMAQNC
jgi:hypothetical protein